VVGAFLLSHPDFPPPHKEASAVKRDLKAAIGLALVLLIVLSAGCSKRKQAEDKKTPSTGENKTEVLIQPGWAFENALQELDLSAERTTSIINALSKVFDFKRCIPGDMAVLITDTQNQFKRFEYHQSPTRYYVVEPRGPEMIAREVKLTTEKKVYFMQGNIQSSLYDAVMDLKETGELAYLLSDIFAWDIDFNVETRKGDHFSLLVVKEFLDSEFVGYGPILYATYDGEVGPHEATRYEDPSQRTDYYDQNGRSLRKAFLRSALQYRRISSYFSRRRYHPILKRYRPHHGVDYAAPTGTPVSAIGDGVVTWAGWKGGYGKFISIRHVHGYQSGYGHLSRFAKGIKSGRSVKQGQLIGYVGSTGVSTGAHLHFEIRRYGSFINPLKVDIPAADPVPKKYMAFFQKQRSDMLSVVKAFELMGTTRELADISKDAAAQAQRDSTKAPKAKK
jgi:murein DD-endopeptidase MepM/ murein hydrolase activator NlpD